MRAFVRIIVGAQLVVCACGQAEVDTGSLPDAKNDEAGDATPTDVPADFRRVEAHCGYSFMAPPGVSVRPADGTDSCIDVWTASGCMQRGDYGAFNGDLNEYAGELDYAPTLENVHGRVAKLVTMTMAKQGLIAAAHFAELDVKGVTLTVWAECEDAPGQTSALASFRTIIFDR
jgi:hypothetical protein